jgi:methionyl aminopeptidase
VIAVEPLVAEHSGAVRLAADRWTIRTRDGGWTAHAEHTIVVTASGAQILTRLDEAAA